MTIPVTRSEGYIFGNKKGSKSCLLMERCANSSFAHGAYAAALVAYF
jgi:hypothetical protein